MGCLVSEKAVDFMKSGRVLQNPFPLMDHGSAFPGQVPYYTKVCASIRTQEFISEQGSTTNTQLWRGLLLVRIFSAVGHSSLFIDQLATIHFLWLGRTSIPVWGVTVTNERRRLEKKQACLPTLENCRFPRSSSHSRFLSHSQIGEDFAPDYWEVLCSMTVQGH